MNCWKRTTHLMVGAVLFIMGGAVSVAMAFEPQDLVGEWQGQWQNKFGTGRFSVTIKSADEKEVSGTVYTEVRRASADYHNREVAFKGTITKTGISGLLLDLYPLVLNVVKDNRMEGTFKGAVAPADVWVEKKAK